MRVLEDDECSSMRCPSHADQVEEEVHARAFVCVCICRGMRSARTPDNAMGCGHFVCGYLHMELGVVCTAKCIRICAAIQMDRYAMATDVAVRPDTNAAPHRIAAAWPTHRADVQWAAVVLHS